MQHSGNMNNLVHRMTAVAMKKIVPQLERLIFLPLLAMRLWIANVFFQSGLSKLSYWDGTLGLFEEEYRVPLLPPDIAAYLATGIELAAPVLLVLGLGSRLAALLMLLMAVVIELTYMHFDIHLVWMMILSMLIFQGPGRISCDYYIRRCWEKRHHD